MTQIPDDDPWCKKIVDFGSAVWAFKVLLEK
jgi:hypothetical protein